MKKLVLLATMAAYCCETQSTVAPHYQDVVKFRFTGGNVFYEKACSDKGIVIGQISTGFKQYLLLVKCGNSFKSIWVNADDIVSVVNEK
jgi:hypothetical protein